MHPPGRVRRGRGQYAIPYHSEHGSLMLNYRTYRDVMEMRFASTQGRAGKGLPLPYPFIRIEGSAHELHGKVPAREVCEGHDSLALEELS